MTQDSIDRHEGDIRQYLWKYFQLHSSQRLTTFNFYIGISAVITTGYVLALKEGITPIVAVVLGLVLSLLSFIFWKLDERNKLMIKNAEEGLKYLEHQAGIQEDSDMAHILNIFTYEETETKKLKEAKSTWFWRKHFSYANCFNMVFALFGILGLLGVISAVITVVTGCSLTD
ncbi:hypothetical protein ES703_65450 [subsurface metagenome]